VSKIIIVITFISLSFSVLGQNTLEQAKKKNQESKYNEALNLLVPYLETHKDLNSLWLYGQTLHLAKKYKKSRKTYQEAISLFPNSDYLKLDYAAKLAEGQKFNEALAILTPYSDEGSYQLLALKKIATIYYWQGKYDRAKMTLDKAFKISSNEKELLALADKIAIAQKNWVEVDFSKYTDDQPQSQIIPKSELGFYINDNISAGVKQDISKYSYLEEASSSKIGARGFVNINLHPIKTKSEIELGFDKIPAGKTVLNTSLLVLKQLNKSLTLEASTSYKPYLLTNISLDEKIMQQQYGGALVLNHKTGFNGRLLYEMNKFENNHYFTKGGWILSPTLKASVFEMSLGYGYSFSNSDSSSFVAVNSPGYLLDNWSPSMKVNGIYNPLFTPVNQEIHMVIGVLDVRLSKDVKLGTTISYGFKSTTDNPYLFLNKDKDNQTIIETDYVTITYTPLDINSYIAYKIAGNLDLNFYHKYQTTKYYKGSFIGVKVNYLF